MSRPKNAYRTIRYPANPQGILGPSTLSAIALLAALLTCAFTMTLTGHTSSPLTLQQELASRPPEAAAALFLPSQPAEEEAATARPPAGGKLSPVFTPEVQYWGKRILAWAKEWGLDPNLVATVMQIESCGDPQATSRAGAMGLFQVMPYHFQPGERPYDPATNAKRGLGYLSDSLATHTTPRLALAGYNGGINGVKRAEAYWAAETVRYAYWGSGIYAEASAGDKESATLNEWLNAGGASLCAQARERLGLKP